MLMAVTVILLPQPALGQEKVYLTLRVVPDRYDNEVTVGEDNIFFLEIRNIGNEAITDIRLLSDGPEDWIIELEPDKLDYLGAGHLQTVDVNIRPAERAERGNYRITLIAEAEEIRRVEIMWVEVGTSPFWLWIGGIILAVVIAGFIIVFWRLNRRSRE